MNQEEIPKGNKSKKVILKMKNRKMTFIYKVAQDKIKINLF